MSVSELFSQLNRFEFTRELAMRLAHIIEQRQRRMSPIALPVPTPPTHPNV